jgi:hypothetical protein
MARCEVCGNEYDKAMEITVAGFTHVFDSFECAIHAIAPRCEHCGCTVIGHGHEADGRFFCCAHCASQEGVRGSVDRVDREIAGARS